MVPTIHAYGDLVRGSAFYGLIQQSSQNCAHVDGGIFTGLRVRRGIGAGWAPRAATDLYLLFSTTIAGFFLHCTISWFFDARSTAPRSLGLQRHERMVVGVPTITKEAATRPARMLQTALGRSITAWLKDPEVVEIMLNPDGCLWIDRLTKGQADTGARLDANAGLRIVQVIADHVGVEVHARSPLLSAELPESGERFQGLIPPVVTAPTFSIRKPAAAVFTLEDYVRAGIMTAEQSAFLRNAVAERRNILVAGGTSTGKTTLANALLDMIAQTNDRVLLIEDTRELQCLTRNIVAMRTKDGIVSLSDLVRSSLRMRPDRIIVGEVRGGEALDLIKAWGTGHPGGIGTIHAGTAIGALRRLEQLVQEAVVTVPRALIAETIELIAVLGGRGRERRLVELSFVEGLGSEGEYQMRRALQY